MKYLVMFSAFVVGATPNLSSQEIDEAQLRNYYRNHSFVRVWNFCEPGTEPLSVEIGSGGNKIQADDVRWHDIGDYRPVSPGSSSVSLRRGDTVVATPTIPFQAGTWQTVIALPVGADFRLDVIDDTYDFEAATTAEIKIFNALADKVITVSAPGSEAGGRQIASFEQLALSGINPNTEEIQISFDGENGREEHLVPLNFTFGKSMAVIALKDRYERTRVRGIYRGFVDEGFVPIE